MSLTGVGVHTGADVCVRIAPRAQGHGIVFRRTDLDASVRASWRNVAATRLATCLEEGRASVSTVEHLMSALSAFGVRDACIEIDGPEVPIMDGSAAPFAAALAPVLEAAGAGPAIRVRRPVSVRRAGAFAALLPYEGRRFDVGIDFPDRAIGVQRVTVDVSPACFVNEVAPARTFGRLADVRRMRRRGYGRGASLENAIAVDGARVINPDGLRFPDEFARHKLLDALGDLALAEQPILGLYRSHKAGHALNYGLLAALFADERNVQFVT